MIRGVCIAALAATAASRASGPEYQVSVREITTMDDGESSVVDTAFVEANVGLRVTDSASGTLLAFSIQSPKFRHTTGTGSSPLLEPDLQTAGMTALFRIIPGQPLFRLPSASDERSRVVVSSAGTALGPAAPYLSGVFSRIWPAPRQTMRAGRRWVDTTIAAAGTTISDWNIATESGGRFDVTVRDSSTTSANVDGGHISTIGVVTATFTARNGEPVMQATVTQHSVSVLIDPIDEPHRLTVTRDRVMQIVRAE